jgi:hypothetical protein
MRIREERNAEGYRDPVKGRGIGLTAGHDFDEDVEP